ncbi:MAG: hypothetical protein MN733_38820, partial [Nitrososphaera sp.]|nr:hypothetical protein [Nitrososphaera sp.]
TRATPAPTAAKVAPYSLLRSLNSSYEDLESTVRGLFVPALHRDLDTFRSRLEGLQIKVDALVQKFDEAEDSDNNDKSKFNGLR